MVKKIVHISICNNYPGLNKLLFIPECVNAGLDVYYLNLTKLIGGETQGLSATDCPELEVATLNELDNLLLKFHGDTLFNVQINYEYRWKSIFKIIKKRCELTSRFSVGTYPLPNFYNSLGFKSFNAFPRKIFTRFLNRKAFFPTYVFAAGRVSASRFCNNSKIIKIEYPEIDNNASLSHSLSAKKPFIVFIDQYTPFHPDRKLTGIVARDADLYYKHLIEYFDHVERCTGMEIVVAAHPKSKYTPNFFGNRRVLINCTERLIFESSLVLAHFSTAVCYAVKYKKPLVFISSTNETGLDIEKYVVPFSRYLNAPCHKLGFALDEFPNFEIDMVRYMNYEFDFLTWPDKSQIVSSSSFPEFIMNFV